MSNQSDVHLQVTTRALTARLPVLANERIYTNYSSLMWTFLAFNAATWAYLIGGALPFIGNTKIGLAGFFAGAVIGLVPVTLASGMPSLRYGVDTIEAAKAPFGTRGIVLPLVASIATLVGWSCVVIALTAQGAANATQAIGNSKSSPSLLLMAVGVAAVLATWLVVVRGPWLFERISNYVAPGHLVLAGVMVAVLLVKFPLHTILNTNVPANEAFTPDRLKGFVYAFEFGFAGSLSWWPGIGGLSRLVKRQNQLVGPAVVGFGILSGFILCGIGSFAAVMAGTYDPTVWMETLGGHVLGTIMIAFLLIANIPSIVILVYMAGVQIQQVRVLARLPWRVAVAIILILPLVAAFNSAWVLKHTINLLSYNGLMFAGVTAVTFVDYFILRRQNIEPRELFRHGRAGKYWFWGGVNWVAIGVVAMSFVFYLWMLNPVTLATHGPFRYTGVSIPTLLLSGAVYYAVTRLVTIRQRKGGYGRSVQDLTGEAETARTLAEAGVSL